MFEPKPRPAPAVHVNEDPYPSTYVRYPGVPTVIRHATVFDGDGRRFDNGTEIFAAGADSIAVVSDVTQAADPDARVRAWLQTFAQAA